MSKYTISNMVWDWEEMTIRENGEISYYLSTQDCKLYVTHHKIGAETRIVRGWSEALRSWDEYLVDKILLGAVDE